MKAIVWIVEMWESGQWLPTVGTALTRADGRRSLDDWRDDFPDDKFRLRRYARKEAA